MKFRLEDVLSEEDEGASGGNPFLADDDQEDSDETPLRLSQTIEADGSVSTTTEVDEDAARAALKAKRAAKRAQNHADHPKWFKRSLTDKDLDFLNFLAQAKYAKADHLALLHGTTRHTAYKRLKGLEEYGFVESRKLHGTADLWGLTPKGIKRSKWADVLTTVPVSAASWGAMPHQFIKNYIAASVLGGVSPFRFEDGTNLTLPPKIEVLDERTIEAMFRKQPDHELAKFYLKEDEATSKLRGRAASKLPDLVLWTGKTAIAIEIELNYKGHRKTAPILRLYGNQSVFRSAIYVIPDKQDYNQFNSCHKQLANVGDYPPFKEHAMTPEQLRKIRSCRLWLPSESGFELWEEDTQFLYGK